jgi:uncharacterized protein YbjT (DUF2867 family)
MKVLVFGATGSAGASVLRSCLPAADVSAVSVIARRPLDVAHPKVGSVVVHRDFLDFTDVAAAFSGIDACLYCLGVSVRQVPDEQMYRTITHDFALAAARMMQEQSPAAAFHFISGKGARLDSRFMWARLKAETERDLIDLVEAVCWRPALIDGESSQRGPGLFEAVRPLLRMLRPFRSLSVTGDEIGRAMLQATREGLRGRIVENPEIRSVAARTGR